MRDKYATARASTVLGHCFFCLPFFFNLEYVFHIMCQRGVWFMIVANPPQFPKYRNFYPEQGRLPISVFIKSLYSF